MTNLGLTEIIYILDRSGSMAPLTDDVIGGFNRFVEEQVAQPGEAILTLVQFDHVYSLVTSGCPLAVLPELTRESYVPRGSTALYDAIARTIDDVGVRLAHTPESKRPSKVIVAIMTDGYENASKRHTQMDVFRRIKWQQEKYNWEFVYLGANQDAYTESAKIGVSHSASFAATGQSVGQTYDSFSASVAQFRAGGSPDILDLGDLRGSSGVSTGAIGSYPDDETGEAKDVVSKLPVVDKDSTWDSAWGGGGGGGFSGGGASGGFDSNSDDTSDTD